MAPRQDPEEILKQIVKLSSGRHKVYLGMAPGVGKTYKMLEEAQELKRGIDIIVGYIESQDREDNQKLIENLEVIPRKCIKINNNDFYEMDLETIIDRKPACVIIDELAHKNLPGSLNQKRYQDIQEILKNGISVLSTLNVHQIESIAPQVERSIGIKVKETVPDWVINNVDDIVVVDLPIDELYKRLETKKIYGEEQLKHALKNFFKRNNLLMLRDLSLNYIAEKVDTEIITENLKTKIRERILVTFTPEKHSIKVLKHAMEISKYLHAGIDILCFSQKQEKQTNKIISDTRELLKEIKGNFILIEKSKSNFYDIIIQHVIANRITILIIGNEYFFKDKSIKSDSILSKVLLKTDNLDVLIIGNIETLINETPAEISTEHLTQTYRPGELKIYIGMAPGVGKTYKMLQEAQEMYSTGKNILLGVIDTHGREDTAKLMEGLPLLPQKIIKHQGKMFEEFDLESAILKKPEIIYVDELAHSNVPGAINNKRYQDVQYLLRAGIDVVTTVNIQHIESLNDIVEQFSGIKVRETVPDWIISHANEIILIDISPEALQERLKEGKVYSLDKIEQALSHFFQKKNLIALRELSLREVAENVEHELFPKQTHIKLLCIIDINDETLRIIRKASRFANRLQAELIVIHIIENTSKLIDSRKLSIIELEELVVELGGDFRLIEGKSFYNELFTLIEKIKPHYLIINKPTSDISLPFLKQYSINKIIKTLPDMHVWVVSNYEKK